MVPIARRSSHLGLLILHLVACSEPRMELRELSTGERPIAARATHTYAAPLAEGELLHVVVEQLGLDLVVELYGPDQDAPLLVADGLTWKQGTEEVVWLAKRAGEYRLAIRNTFDTDGRYAVRRAEQRLADELDRRRAAAAHAFAAAETLRGRDERDSWLSAVDRYDDALALWREVDDRPGQARALYRLGLLHADRLGLPSEAARFYDAARELLEGTGNTWLLASTHHQLGILHRRRGDMEAALEHYQAARRLWHEVGYLAREAEAVNNLGYVHRILGELQQALTLYDEALQRWRQLGQRAEEARVLQNRGRCYLYLGRYEQALDDLRSALSIREEIGRKDPIAHTLHAIGQVHESRRDWEQALLYYRRAAQLRRETGHRRGRAVTLSNLGSVYKALGRDREALDALERSLAIHEALGDPLQEASVLHKIGWQLEPTDPRSRDHFRAALAIYERLGNLNGQVQALHGIARCEHALGRLPEALESNSAALEILEALRANPASPTLRASYFSTMQGLHDVQIDLLMELDARHPGKGYDRRALAASERARARSQLDLITASARWRVGSDPELSLRQDDLETRIGSLELERLHLVENQVGPEQLATIDRRLRELLREYEQLEAEARRSTSHEVALAPARPLDAAEVQELLDADTLLLEYKLGREHNFVWAVTRDAIASFELPEWRRIDHAARVAYQRLSTNSRVSRGPTQVALAELSDLVLAPVADLLDQRRLLIVTEGALQYVPFAVLPLPGSTRRLIDDHEIRYVPSVSTLAALRERVARRAEPALGQVAVVADPVFQAHDPRLGSAVETPAADGERVRGGASPPRRYERLVHSRDEAKAILELVPESRSRGYFGFEATREVVTGGELGRYRIVHIATHGDLEADRPELTRLVFSLVDEERRGRNGLLHAHEIYDLDLPVDLVTLSACRTALGKEVRREGLVGLTQAFMVAGASRVLVSLWQVDDRATAELMSRFYRHLLTDGLPPAAALRAAQLSIAAEERWQAPYYWASFVLQGEW